MGLRRHEARVYSGTGDGGGLSGTIAYTDAVDASNAVAALIEFRYVKSGVDLTLSIVDGASDSANATVAALKFPLVSTLQSGTGTAAVTHSIAATTTGAIAINLGGLVKNLRVGMTLSGAGSVNDVLNLRVILVEEA